MATQFRVSAAHLAEIRKRQDELLELHKSIDTLGDELTELVEKMREAYDDRSDRWREGDRASDVDSWIDDLDTLATDVNDLAETMTTVADALGDIQEQPEYSS